MAAALLLVGDRGREEVVRLVPGLLRGREAHRADELWEQLELLEDLGVEHAAALVLGEGFEPVGRLSDTVPADERCARLLRLPEADEEVREADDRSGGEPGRAPQRFRERVVGPMRERVAVDR